MNSHYTYNSFLFIAIVFTSTTFAAKSFALAPETSFSFLSKVSPLAMRMTEKKLIKKGDRVLSLACGQAFDEEYFALLGASVLAVDNNEMKLSKARQRKSRSIDLNLINREITKEFDFEPLSFDVVYIRLGIHYFGHKDQLNLLNKIHRVLKPGGIVVIQGKSEKDFYFKHAQTELHKDGLFLIGLHGYLRSFFTEQSLITLFRETNFIPVSFTEEQRTLYDDQHTSSLITAIGKKEERIYPPRPVRLIKEETSPKAVDISL